MTVTITADQRDALYEDILVRLAAIEDVWTAASVKNFEEANRLALAYSDELRLLAEDLGWGDRAPPAPIELKTPPDVLHRAFDRIRDLSLGLSEAEEKERSALQESQQRTQLVLETCNQVLAGLDATS